MTEQELKAWIEPRLEFLLSNMGCTLLLRSTWNLIDDDDRALCIEHLSSLFAEAGCIEPNLLKNQ